MPLISLLFFLSGISGLIYQVVWVREFGNVFGNTVYSASLIIAVFMLGLGAGSYVVGRWADRRYAAAPGSLLRAYGVFEIAIGAAGLAVAAFLPHLGFVSALASSYSRDANGWHALSASSYAARIAIAAVLLTPITLLMGGTLTLLIRYCVRVNNALGAWRIALLYGVNTAGAALGAFLTDFTLVPAVGLQKTQWIAVLCNVAAGVGAVLLASRPATQGLIREPAVVTPSPTPTVHHRDAGSGALPWTSLALALSGFAAMGMEIVWFRHFTILMGGFRAVFSLLLTVILIGIGAGALAGGWLNRVIARPVQLLMLAEGFFVAASVLGLASADVRRIHTAEAYAAGLSAAEAGGVGELWFVLKPMLFEVAIPALLMGLTFPLANAIVQQAERVVGRRAGVLYFANTLGAVCGSLIAGFLLLPAFGMQTTATLLTAAAALTILPLYLASRRGGATSGRPLAAPATAAWVSSMAIALWLLAPRDFLLARAQMPLPQGQQRVVLVEGINELVSVVDVGTTGRLLLTNDHSMSGTTPGAQRYMRALAHIPLLSMDRPETALVIGFGVGNTTHAITLHPTVRRVEVADLSKEILQVGPYFAAANQNVLDDPRVAVFINDGRQHLRMRGGGPYDLIALEPPPIAHAGVGSLYSREFYRLANQRLTAGGFISQWLPAYQVPADTTLALVRAFVDVFPQSVLLCGTNQELLLVGTRAARIEIDPQRVAAALAAAPAVQADLQRVGLGTVTDIVATFVGAPSTLHDATRAVIPVTDDRPVQEYGAKSRLTRNYELLPASIFDLSQVSAWCPRCFVDGAPAPLVQGLDDRLRSVAPVYEKMLRR